LLRFVVIAAVFAGLALAAPRIAPALLGSLLDSTGQAAPDPAAESSPLSAEAVQPRLPEVTERIQVVDGRRVTISADASGHYLVDARINGRAVSAMVDTGATVVALSTETARRLGINPPRSAFTRPVATANGIVDAAPATLSEIRIGRIVVRNVEALVIPGDSLAVDLLGMSFLGRLQKFESSGGRLILFQ
jgi:aspartyl protease family protein